MKHGCNTPQLVRAEVRHGWFMIPALFCTNCGDVQGDGNRLQEWFVARTPWLWRGEVHVLKEAK